MRKTWFVLLLLAATAVAKADTFDGTSRNVYFAVDANNDTALGIMNYWPVFSPANQLGGPEGAKVSSGGPSDPFALSSGSALYSNAGIVLYPNGRMTLGQLQSVSMDSYSEYATMSIALLLDPLVTDDGYTSQGMPFQLLSPQLGSCSFADSAAPSVSLSSSCSFDGPELGIPQGPSYTLAELIAGDDPGVDASTPVALWISVFAGDPTGGWGTITQVDVTRTDTDPSATPEPSSLILLGTGFLGLVGVMRKRMA